MIIAHRGVSFNLPENSLPAFEASWSVGVDGIEGDFHLTSDGVIVCIHDEDTQRVCNTKKIIHSSTIKELKQLELNHVGDDLKFRIPTISEVIQAIPYGKKFFIEIKCGTEIILPLLNQLSGSSMSSDDVVIISFDSEVIKELKELEPVYKALLLYSCEEDRDIDKLIDEALKIKADGISTDNENSKTLVKKIISSGLEYHSWTIDGPEIARQLIQWGSSSITTNDPETLIKQI
jgi:glycerophosphoryl diester phosphodiesterase